MAALRSKAGDAWVARVLGVVMLKEREEDLPPSGVVAYRKALLNFAKAKKSAADQIAALTAAIPAALPHEADMANALEAELTDLTDAIAAAVDTAMCVARSEREPFNSSTRAMIAAYIEGIENSELIAHVDSNPFVPMNLRATIGAALAEIAKYAV